MVRSFEELKELYEGDISADKRSNQDNYIQSYNKSYFTDNALIVLCIERSSGALGQKVDKITMKSNQLYIKLNWDVKNDQGSISNIGTLIEVKKTDIDNIKDILIFKAEQD